MLIELDVKNIALVESLRLEFSEGLNVLTGETGAGKSIIVDSLGMSLGARADKELIRTGAEKAQVQAVFDAANAPDAVEAAREVGADVDDCLIALSRELSRSGRNVCRVNGSVVPLASLKRVAEHLMDIHGQHEHQALIDPARHIGFLDSFGDLNHKQLMSDTAHAYSEYAKAASEYRRATTLAAENARMRDMLEFQVNEIFKIKPKRGEEEKLEKRAKFYENAERIRESVQTAYALTYASTNGTPSAQEQLSEAVRMLESVAAMDERIAELVPRVKDAFYSAQDVGYELRSLLDGISFDADSAEKVADRLDKIRKLERKYGGSLDEVIDFGEDAQKKLDSIKENGTSADELKARALKLLDELKAVSAQLTQSRRMLSEKLAIDVMDQLKDLGMGKTRFAVDMRSAKVSANGADEIEFLISANPGEPLKPMAAVASGGELSRIMLALKAISIEADGVDSMVFDEIDTGVSGRMAQAVGNKMKKIAQRRQVLCVTHLPQIAALGDAHYVVEKYTDGERTGSITRRLDEDGRVMEISRLIGDGEDSETSISHARHMLGLS